MDDFIAIPEWTEVPQKGGLDPLGMQAAGVRLYQTLVPGISNVTLRMRYYGFYAWLSSDYAVHTHNPDSEIWKKTVRRAEALYALAAAKAIQDRVEEPGVAGTRWARRTLKRQQRAGRIDFAGNADPEGRGTPYLKQKWGAYGAAYESQLIATGILGTADAHDLSVPTKEIGDEAADAFARAVGEAGAKFLNVVGAGHVSLNRLDEVAPLLPSSIPAQSRERNVYERLLFAEIPNPTEQDMARRRTLILAT